MLAAWPGVIEVTFWKGIAVNAMVLARDVVMGAGGVWTWLAALLVGVPMVFASAVAGAGGAASPVRAARELIDATPPNMLASLRQPFTDEARSDWHYTPRRRTGIAWRDMNPREREATTALLRTALNDAGLDKVRAVMALEIALRELETFGSARDPQNYALAIFGEPSTEPKHWGFRLEGHHLSLHFTLQGDRYVATLPQFLGANPALVAEDVKGEGPRKGTRVLGVEEDLARALLGALHGPQRAAALFDTRTYGDIVTRNAAKLSPLAPVGVKLAELAPPQQAALLKLISAFADHLQPELAEARLARVRSGGLDSIRFGWAGSVEARKPYYFRIQGATFLIELDNSGGNHVHSVWRDFAGDWGRDILGEHYSAGPSQGHSH
jgi:hypothetical protein